MQRKPELFSRIRLKRKWTTTQWFRLASLLLFFVLTAIAIVRHRINEAAGLEGPANQAPGVDALSPMGGLETLWSWIQTGDILRHLHLSDIALLVAAVALVALLGGAFCGWICPFGAIQEWLYRLRSRFIPWKVTIPKKVDRVLKYGRYLVLALVLAATYSLGDFIFGDYCPWKAAWNIGSEDLAIGGAIVLGLVVVGSLFIERFWCRYACPLGGFLGLFNKLAPVKLRRAEPTCTGCSLCSRKCPMGIDVSEATVVSDTSCIRCLECVDSCPKQETLDLKVGKKGVPGPVYGVIAAAIFGGVILASMATGNWEAYATQAPPTVSEESGQANTEEIKGWRSLQEITDLWGMPQDLLYRELELDQASVPPSTTLKELETATDGRVDRTVVADLIARWQKGEVK